MKVTILFAVCLVQYFVIDAQAKAMTDEHKDLMINTATDCQKETGATDGDLEELMKRASPSTKTGKCMRKCIMEKLNMLKGGKIDVDACEEWAKKTNPNDPALVKAAREIAQTCSAAVTEADPCEYIAKLITCFKEQATTRGMDTNKVF